jgi:hypothetical protein
MHVVVVNEGGGNGDEGDIAGKAAIVEPVIANGGYTVDQAGGVDGDDDKVGARVEDSGHFAIKRREAAFVIADPLLIHPNMGAVVSCTDVEKRPGAGFGPCVEVALIPYDPLVVE